jgi:excisionase family DNA binding protein
MPRRPTPTDGDPYDALANALRAIMDDVVDRVVAALKAGVAGETNDVLVSVPDAAGRLGLGTTKLKELMKAGDIASVKVGERRLIPVSALDAFSTEQLRTATLTPESSRIHLSDAAERGRSP